MCEILSCDGLSLFATVVFGLFNTTVMGVLALILSVFNFYRYWQPILMTGKRLIFISRGINYGIFALALFAFQYLPLVDARATLRFSLGILVIAELLYNYSVIHFGRWGEIAGHREIAQLSFAWTKNKTASIAARIRTWTRN